MEYVIDWHPNAWSNDVTVTFSFYRASGDTVPFLVVPQPFRASDAAIGDTRILSAVTDALLQVQRAAVAYDALTAALDPLTGARVPVGDEPVVWVERSYASVPGIAGFDLTLAYALAADAPDVWFSETTRLTATDPTLTPARLVQLVADREARVDAMVRRAQALAAALGIVPGVRAPVPVGGGA